MVEHSNDGHGRHEWREATHGFSVKLAKFFSQRMDRGTHIS